MGNKNTKQVACKQDETDNHKNQIISTKQTTNNNNNHHKLLPSNNANNKASLSDSAEFKKGSSRTLIGNKNSSKNQDNSSEQGGRLSRKSSGKQSTTSHTTPRIFKTASEKLSCFESDTLDDVDPSIAKKSFNFFKNSNKSTSSLIIPEHQSLTRVATQHQPELNCVNCVKLKHIPSPHNKTSFYVQSKPLSLSQIVEQRYNSSKHLPYSQILTLAQAMSYSLAYLSKKNIPHHDFYPTNVYYIDKGFKLINPLQLSVTGFYLTSERQRFSFLSPQLIIAILQETPESELSTQVLEKADVFAMGMILLQVCTLQPSSECYDEESYNIVDSALVIRERISKVSNVYTGGIAHFINLMLHYEVKERLNPVVLAQLLHIKIDNEKRYAWEMENGGKMQGQGQAQEQGQRQGQGQGQGNRQQSPHRQPQPQPQHMIRNGPPGKPMQLGQYTQPQLHQPQMPPYGQPQYPPYGHPQPPAPYNHQKFTMQNLNPNQIAVSLPNERYTRIGPNNQGFLSSSSLQQKLRVIQLIKQNPDEQQDDQDEPKRNTKKQMNLKNQPQRTNSSNQNQLGYKPVYAMVQSIYNNNPAESQPQQRLGQQHQPVTDSPISPNRHEPQSQPQPQYQNKSFHPAPPPPSPSYRPFNHMPSFQSSSSSKPQQKPMTIKISQPSPSKPSKPSPPLQPPSQRTNYVTSQQYKFSRHSPLQKQQQDPRNNTSQHSSAPFISNNNTFTTTPLTTSTTSTNMKYDIFSKNHSYGAAQQKSSNFNNVSSGNEDSKKQQQSKTQSRFIPSYRPYQPAQTMKFNTFNKQESATNEGGLNTSLSQKPIATGSGTSTNTGEGTITGIGTGTTTTSATTSKQNYQYRPYRRISGNTPKKQSFNKNLSNFAYTSNSSNSYTSINRSHNNSYQSSSQQQQQSPKQQNQRHNQNSSINSRQTQQPYSSPTYTSSQSTTTTTTVNNKDVKESLEERVQRVLNMSKSIQ